MKKKGVSPIIATVLLISIVVVMAAIIFLWARGFVAEKAQKFGRAVDLSCGDIALETGIFNDNGNYMLDVTNTGNIPIYGFEIKKIQEGSVDLFDPLTEEEFGSTITAGSSQSISLGSRSVSAGDKLLVVPIILGKDDNGKVPHTCSDETGFRVDII